MRTMSFEKLTLAPAAAWNWLVSTFPSGSTPAAATPAPVAARPRRHEITPLCVGEAGVIHLRIPADHCQLQPTGRVGSERRRQGGGLTQHRGAAPGAIEEATVLDAAVRAHGDQLERIPGAVDRRRRRQSA